MSKVMLAGLAVMTGSTFAMAEADCPADAFQQIYSVRAAMLSGQVKDANTPYSVAMAGIQQCPDDAGVQGLSSTVLAILASALEGSGQNEATRQKVLENAFEAALTNEALYSISAASPKVKFADGTEKTVYIYSEVNHYLKTVIYPEFFRLHMDGSPQAMFSGAPLERCPYPGDQDRARIEVETLAQLPPTYFIMPDLKDVTGFAEVEARLLALRDACESVSAKATWELAGMHNERRSKLQENLGYGYYADSRDEVISETEFHAQQAEAYYRAFWYMDVSNSDDQANQEAVSGRLGFLSVAKMRLDELK